MDESANTGLELNCEIRKSSISRISVEGYDTSLCKEDVDEALRQHMASCGNIIHVYVPMNVESGILCRYALVYVNEEDEEKALKLDGSEIGGRILKMKSYPFHDNHLNDDYLAPMKEGLLYRPQLTMLVTGCDTSLPIDVIKTQLKEYFSALGTFVYEEDDTPSGASKIVAIVYVRGQEGVEKALERSGRCVEGLNFVVDRVVPLPKIAPKIGYNLARKQIEDPNTRAGNHKKKSKTTERNQKKNKREKKKKKKKSKTSVRLGTR